MTTFTAWMTEMFTFCKNGYTVAMAFATKNVEIQWLPLMKIGFLMKMELRLSKSTARQMKCQIRKDYDWDGKKANFADSVLSFAKQYLFPHFEFFEGRMDGL